VHNTIFFIVDLFVLDFSIFINLKSCLDKLHKYKNKGHSMSEYQIVTTMHSAGYDLYGRKMIDSFLKFWPAEYSMVVYTEGFSLDQSLANNPRLTARDLPACSPELVSFKQRHQHNRKAHGFVEPTRKDPDFAFDAVRFSHKVFALYHAIHNRPNGINAIVWLDADTVTHASIPNDFLNSCFPLKPDIGIYYLGRTQQHSECGWMIFNCLNAHMQKFWEMFANQYKLDELFKLNEWHDSYVFDHVRTYMENTAGMINHNITPGYVRGHPFIDSFLGEYMDHLKGPKRKIAGRSAKFETSNKKAQWWNE
jgi:hypothetical protein